MPHDKSNKKNPIYFGIINVIGNLWNTKFTPQRKKPAKDTVDIVEEKEEPKNKKMRTPGSSNNHRSNSALAVLSKNIM